jgi:hypothetical protein
MEEVEIGLSMVEEEQTELLNNKSLMEMDMTSNKTDRASKEARNDGEGGDGSRGEGGGGGRQIMGFLGEWGELFFLQKLSGTVMLPNV